MSGESLRVGQALFPPSFFATPGFAPRVRAVLGPTNTGKTHLAMTRLLAHSSGIIGFPLRLLARENYDRMVAAKGARAVALITGEEKIVPPDARWFSCTVEAMPLDRHVEFLAVDEIQLCADPDRGHVFTDRLLHARGLVETMFLGAETIRPLLHRLIPGAEIETRPRLSQLAYAGPVKLTKLPPRSAIVAFSAAEVYAIAELIRRRRGGCAVVMGRLSPRTRNAQVALYQDKEVDFLVATDAIGMGLNMDVNHVAFAGLQKFDGQKPRRLTAAEVAQIGGRAGRGMRDGTFGTTGTCAPLPDEIVEAVEAHVFDPIESLAWRNSALDFSHIDRLLDSLTAPPPIPGLTRGNDASDLETLAALAREPEIRALAQGRRQIRLLWDACQVPDFRKITDDSHVRLCARIYGHLAHGQTLPADWLDQQFAALAGTEGDIDTLMARLSGVRVWSYIAARADWIADAATWQNRARDIEDKLSDVLHERLTARFVDRRAAHLMRRLEEVESGDDLLSAVTARGEVVVEGHPVGHVAGFAFLPDPLAEGPEKRLVLRAARRALREEMPRRVALLEAAADTAFTLGRDHHIAWDSAPVARLRPGAGFTRPAVEILDSEFLDGPQRERLRLRLQAWVDAWIAGALAPLFAAAARAETHADLRGPLHRLVEQGGLVAGSTETIPQELRGALKAIGVRAGRFALYLPDLLKPRAAAIRARLWALQAKISVPDLPNPGLVSIASPEDSQAAFLQAMGWVQTGPVLLRLDIAERIAAELAYATRGRPAPLPPDIGQRLGLRADLVPAVLRGLGLRILPAQQLAPTAYGPPAPPMLASPRKRPAVSSAPKPPVRPDHPFAALAALRR
jgi:ATP-dependent RNA helicase SUPV3L1/SUV3